MNTNLTIKNFRVFDEEGVTIELKPLTILTGCNSSGKSSVVKAVLLLNDFLSQIKKAIDNDEQVILENYKIDFGKYPNNLLGKFDKVVHNGSSNKEVTIAYTTYSRMLSKEVDVEFVFAADINDELNNAYLERLTLKTEDGVFYTSSRQKGTEINLYMLKDACLEFLPKEHCILEYCRFEEEYRYSQPNFSKEEIEELKKNISAFDENDYRNRDVVKYLRYNKRGEESMISKCHAKPEIIEWSKRNDSIFYIPLLEELDKVSKKDVSAFIEQQVIPLKVETAYDWFLLQASHKIVNDFINSDSEKFSEYFKKNESHFLKNIKTGRFNLRPVYVWTENFSCYGDSKSVKVGKKNIPLNTEENLKYWFNSPVTFELLYQILMDWNLKMFPKSDYYFTEIIDPVWYYHYMFKLLATFAVNLTKEAISPEWSEKIEYVSSSRIKVNRLYTLDVEDDFTRLLKKYFDSKRNVIEHYDYSDNGVLCKFYWNNPRYELHDFIKKWVKNFGLGEDILLQLDEDGLGVRIRLQKKMDDEGDILADEGYGITQFVSILLQIETAILSAKGIRVNYMNGLREFDKMDGYQPSIERFQYEPQIVAIEEPEIHLHPKYQSLLAEMFWEAYQKYNIHFIIETHSEYLIRKLQVLVADKESALSANDVSLNYVETVEDGVSNNRQIKIEEDGNLSESFGAGFYDEADTLAIQLFRNKPILS